ncbi:MAG TPA: PAS domain S-box protein [Nitrospirae bacterium]|nr:PAS domain S-box protein [Nitrospirota bacterium]
MRSNLSIKIVTAIVLTIVVVLASGFYVVFRIESANMQSSFMDNSRHIARIFQQQLNQAYTEIRNDSRQIQKLTEHIAALSDVMYVEIYDMHSRVIAHSERELVDKEPEDRANIMYAERIVLTGETLTMEHPDERRYELFMPVLDVIGGHEGEILGVVNLAMEYGSGMDVEAVRNNAMRIGRVLENSASNIFSNYSSHSKYVQELVVTIAQVQGVAHAEVYDMDARIVAHTDREMIDKESAKGHSGIIGDLLKGGNDNTRLVRYEKGLFSLYFPIEVEEGGGRVVVGAAELTMDMGTIEQAISRIRRELIMIEFIFAVSIIVALTIMLRRIVIKPVRELSALMEKAADGDLEVKSVIDSRDEIGSLSDSFNKMIASLKGSRDSLIAARRYTESIIDAMKDALMVIDAEGMIMTVNPSTCYLLGYESEAELVGQSIEKVVSIEAEQMRELKECGFLISDEKCFRTNFGDEIPVYFLASAIYDDDGEMWGAVIAAQDITERMLTEDELRASLKEKNVLIQEIHHRVKNNMQIIMSLTSLQERNVKDAGALKALKESQNRISALALVHEKLYQSSNLAEISVMEYVQSLAGNLFSSYHVSTKHIELVVNVGDVSMNLDTLIPCGLIINELVTNSLKHAFKETEQGTIWVEMFEDKKGEFRLVVRDNGCGMPEGFEEDSLSNTMGFRIVNALVKQLEGDMEIDRTDGTRYTINIFQSPDKSLQ